MRRFVPLVVSVAALLWLGAVRLHAGGVVNGCNQQDLENAAAGGGDVTFNQDCEITLTNTVRFVLTTRLDASGHNVTIKSLLNAVNSSFTNITATTNITSTNLVFCLTNFPCVTNLVDSTITCITNITCATNVFSTTNVTFTTNVISSTTFTNGVRLFEVASNASVSFTALRFASGRGTNGGAILVGTNATAYVTNCVFTNNNALASDGLAGANGREDPVSGKSGSAGGNGEVARGGAICNFGTLTVIRSVFQSNRALGGSGGAGGNGGNGATQGGNGGNGGSGSSGAGGAIYSSGAVSLRDCSFENNTVTGGGGGIGGTNGTGAFSGRKGIGGAGASGLGGGLYCPQSATVVNCTFADNLATGGTSAAGGMASSGNGSDGARGGDGFGGGICNLGNGVTITNCTFSGNQVRGGNAGNGGNGGTVAGDGGNGGNGRGGGLYNAGAISVVNCTFSNGSAVGGTNGLAGTGVFPASAGQMGESRGGNLANFGSSLWLKNTIIATNLSGGGGYGTVTDAGNNISADQSLVFGINSHTNTDPKLGTLANNGGNTKTMVPLPGSPAIDAGDTAAGTNFDQRGFSRPVGLRSDIGAVETSTIVVPPSISLQPTGLSVLPGGNASFSVAASGEPPLSYQWRFNGNNISTATATAYARLNAQPADAGSYTVVITNVAGSVTSQTAVLKVLVSPVISQVRGTTTNVTLAFESLAGLTYVVEYKNTLNDLSWTPLATNLGAGGILSFVDSSTTNVSTRFYRIVVR